MLGWRRELGCEYSVSKDNRPNIGDKKMGDLLDQSLWLEKDETWARKGKVEEMSSRAQVPDVRFTSSLAEYGS